jgi:hypothetical protein
MQGMRVVKLFFDATKENEDEEKIVALFFDLIRVRM